MGMGMDGRAWVGMDGCALSEKLKLGSLCNVLKPRMVNNMLFPALKSRHLQINAHHALHDVLLVLRSSEWIGIVNLESCVWVGTSKRYSLMGGHGWGRIERLLQLGGMGGHDQVQCWALPHTHPTKATSMKTILLCETPYFFKFWPKVIYMAQEATCLEGNLIACTEVQDSNIIIYSSLYVSWSFGMVYHNPY